MSHYWVAGMLDDKSWHGRDVELAGRYIQPGETATEIMRETGLLGVKIVLRPSYYKSNDGNFRQVEGKYQLVVENAPWRDSDYPLNRQISRYEAVQNSDIAIAADHLIDSGMRLRGVGALGKMGEILFVQLAMPDFFVGGHEEERHMSNLVIGDNRKMGSTYYYETDTRVQCFNTWSISIDGIEPIPHSSHPKQWVEVYTRIYMAAMEHREQEVNILNAMFSNELTSTEVNTAISKMVPMPKKTRKMRVLSQIKKYADNGEFDELVEEAEEDEDRFESDIEKAEKKRQAIANKMVEYQDTHSYGKNNYWLWAAVSEIMNHSDFYYNGDSVRALKSIIFEGGRGRELNKAWEICTKLAK